MQKNEINNIQIPKGWKYIPFGDVFEFIQSNALSREQLTFDEHEGEIFNIHYGDIHATYKTDILDFDREEKVPRIKDIIESKSLAFLKEGDLVIADASEDYKGVAANLEIRNIKNRKVTGGLHTFVARDNSGLTAQGFRTYILKNPAITKDLKKLATGSKVYGVSKTNLATLKVLVPPEKEQIKIAKILSTWDTTIETLEQLIAKKERAKKALMQQLLTGKKGLKKYKKVCFTDVAELKHGYQFRDYDFTESGIPVIKIGNLTSGGDLKLDNISYISVSKLNSFKQFLIERGDILMALSGATIGKVSYVDFPIDTMLQNYRVGSFKAMNNKIDKMYLYYILQSSYVQSRVLALMNTGAQPNIGKADFDKIFFPLPEFHEQQKIASLLVSRDNEIKLKEKQLLHYKKQKQGLMQQLLTGKKRVKI